MILETLTRNGALRECISQMTPVVLFIWLYKLSSLDVPALGGDHTNLAFVMHEVSMLLPASGYMESF